MIKIRKFLLLGFAALALLSGQALAHPQPQGKVIAANNLYPQIKMETNKGVIIVELNRVKAPIAVNNFINYVIRGEYNNTIFHRVIEDFVVQGGGYDTDHIPRKNGDEIYNESGNGLKNEVGTIAMARQHDPHSAIRQFYFNVSDNDSLDPGRNWGYTVFGSVTFGEEILLQMSAVETDFNEDLNLDDVPVEPLILIKATLMPEDYIHEG
ncbi:peptidyl-prolyl cis-trans isomerase [Thalassotalea litorea]|uniref:peptidylprolyl isomerase n=1 Tax=Thalassotalea litorea TaxID=2020715 RepID=A0A5R9INW2_9GAMM|nr:peptidylprolyl isomerase [Thalassotalea litorea]TLU61699.1 peptidyl-prolyl cis-trans isomerase [Thalassotalea litorea]